MSSTSDHNVEMDLLGTTTCQRCEHRRASINCSECSLVFCVQCAKQGHAKGRLRSHRLVDIEAFCSQCQGAEISVACDECALSFCGSCASDLHSKGALRKHVLRPTAPPEVDVASAKVVDNGDLVIDLSSDYSGEFAPYRPPPEGGGERMCELCRVLPFTARCHTCRAFYCKDCTAATHTKGRLRSHVLRNLPVCAQCEAAPVAWHCEECVVDLCGPCSGVIHAKGLMGHHALGGIDVLAELPDDSEEQPEEEAPPAVSHESEDEAAVVGPVGNAFFVIAEVNVLRRAIFWLVSHPVFDAFVMLAIIVNCVFLALETPDMSRERAQLLGKMEIVFQVLFSVESALKSVAYGLFLGEHAYLRSHWNKLDFSVVMLGFLSMLPGVGNYSVIRSLRVFRMLKSLRLIEGVRVLVAAMIGSVAQLGHFLVLMWFLVTGFSLMGVQMFAGVMRRRCAIESFDDVIMADEDFICNNDERCERFPPFVDDIIVALNETLSNSTVSIPWKCLPVGNNPGDGFIGFDNFLQASLTVVQVFTLDAWDEDVMDPIIAATGKASILYFLAAVLVGGFFLINVMLAVVVSSYEKSKSSDGEDEEVEDVVEPVVVPTFGFEDSHVSVAQGRADFAALMVSLTHPVGNLPSSNTVFRVNYRTETVDGPPRYHKPVESYIEFRYGEISKVIQVPLIDPNNEVRNDADDEGAAVEEHRDEIVRVILFDASGTARTETRTRGRSMSLSSNRGRSTAADSSTPVVVGASKSTAIVTIEDHSVPGSFTFFGSTLLTDHRASSFVVTIGRMFGADGEASVQFTTVDKTAIGGVDYERLEKRVFFRPLERTREVTVKILEDRNWDKDAKFHVELSDPSSKSGLELSSATVAIMGEKETWIVSRCRTLVSHPVFAGFIMACIIANTITMASEHHGMPKDMETVLWYLNYVFAVVFLVELVLKLIGMNFFYEWLPDRFNIFDAFIVVVSVFEAVLEFSGMSLGVGFSVLRAFRVLRIFKLIKSWDSIRAIIEVVFASISHVSYLSMVTLVFIAIVALMGMQLFGGTYDNLEEQTRFNYDTFFWSCFCIIRVLTGEWALGNREQMAATSVPLGLAFTSINVVVGVTLVLNLFLAILLGQVRAHTTPSMWLLESPSPLPSCWPSC